ncbi:MAG: putative PEP-binding protein, partial [Phycisphaerae bacterium]
TEHMFFDTAERRLAMQEMIIADSGEERRRALDKLQPFQKQDFFEIFRAMDGKPVTIRLIDPPLHEFLPNTEEGVRRLADSTGISADHIRQRTLQLHEVNPMLGHRGCRLCITYPEILEMQVSAIIEAAVQAVRDGVKVLPEIMIPLTIDPKELRILTEQTRAVADAILDDAGIKIDYIVGTMVETPRAALLADRIAEVARFISFGTNDLTQTTMGLSRDDAGRFLPAYVDQDKHAIFKDDPFDTLDIEGVGLLVRWAVEEARKVRRNFKVGICGEHGGDPSSIRFFHEIGLDYVSCSPLRVPIARLAAAQVVIEERAAGTAQRTTTRPAARTTRTSPTRGKKAAAKKRPTKRKPSATRTKKSPATRRKSPTRPKRK